MRAETLNAARDSGFKIPESKCCPIKLTTANDKHYYKLLYNKLFFLFFFFFPKDSLEITIYLKIPEVWYGSSEPILSHSEAKNYLYPGLELWKFKNEFWNDICVISLYGHIPESVRSPTLISLHKRQITLSSFRKGQIKKSEAETISLQPYC